MKVKRSREPRAVATGGYHSSSADLESCVTATRRALSGFPRFIVQNPDRPFDFCERLSKFFITITFCLPFLISSVNAQAPSERPDPRSELVLTAVSPDGGTLAIARSSYEVITRNGRIELWDLKSGEFRQMITGFDGSISNITFSPDGQRILTTSTEYRQLKLQAKPLDRSGETVNEIKWWDARTGDFISKLTLDGSSGGETVFSPDGNTIAVVQRYIYSAGHGFVVEALGAPFETIRRYSERRPVYETFDIKLIDAKTGASKLKMSGRVDSFAYSWALQYVPSSFSPDGRLFAVAAAREVKVWEVATGEKFQRIRKFEGSPLALVFSPDSQSIAVSSGEVSQVDRMTIHESEISVWDVASAKLIRNLRGKNDLVASLKFAGNGKALLFGTLQYEPERTVGTVKVWDFVTSRLATFNVHEGQKVSSLQLLPGKAELLLQSGEDVEVRDTRSWRVKEAFAANHEMRGSRSSNRFLLSMKRVVGIGFSSDGTTVSGVIPEEGVRLWDSRTGGIKPAKQVTITNGLIATSANAKLLGEATAQNIKLWDLSTGAVNVLSRAGSTAVSAFALSPDGELLAFAEGPQIKLRSSSDESPARSLAHETAVEHLAFSTDGRILVSADESGTIKVWDGRSGQLKQSISTGNIVTALAISPTGQYVASAGTDYLISVWNAETAALQLRLKKHENVINAMVFTPDGKTLASGGDDRLVVIWDIMTAKSKHTLKGHDLTVSSLAFSPDGQLLATGTGNASVVLWNVSNGKLDRVLR